MLLYLAWPALRGPAKCPVCLHTLSRVDTVKHTHTHTLAHKASVAVGTSGCSVGNPSQQSAVLTSGTVSSSRHRRKQQKLSWRLTYLSSLSRHLTKIGRMPDFIKSSIGGFLSLESSFLTGEKKTRLQ